MHDHVLRIHTLGMASALPPHFWGVSSDSSASASSPTLTTVRIPGSAAILAAFGGGETPALPGPYTADSQKLNDPAPPLSCPCLSTFHNRAAHLKTVARERLL